MNIFYLSSNQQECAEWLCDIHLRKMIVEYAQLLSNQLEGDVAYKHIQVNHPCSKWVRKAEDNYRWLLTLLGVCLREYEFRFDKKHATENIYSILTSEQPQCHSKQLSLPPPNVTPYKDIEDVTEAYRKYYIHKMEMWIFDKGIVPKWTNRRLPPWINREWADWCEKLE